MSATPSRTQRHHTKPRFAYHDDARVRSAAAYLRRELTPSQMATFKSILGEPSGIARDAANGQEIPVDDLVALVSKLLQDNATLRRGASLASDADIDDSGYIASRLAKLRDESRDIAGRNGSGARLLKILSAWVPPDEFKQISGYVAELLGLLDDLRELADTAENRETNRKALAAADQGDEPPEFAGKPQRNGGLASDETPWMRIGVVDNAGVVRGGSASRHGALERLRKNMSRIGVDGMSASSEGAHARMLAHMARIGHV